MRKLIVHEFIGLDGVVQAPSGKGEDRDGGLLGWLVCATPGRKLKPGAHGGDPGEHGGIVYSPISVSQDMFVFNGTPTDHACEGPRD